MQSARTSWTLIVEAARGDHESRERFAALYGPILRAYLDRRWRDAPRSSWIADALQDVFVECFRGDGVLQRTSGSRPTSFRAYLLGVTQNVALQLERRERGKKERPLESEHAERLTGPDDGDPRRAFEQQWARTLISEALSIVGQESADEGERSDAHLLEMRFREGLPVREIAKRWARPVELVHRDYARARRRFHRALRDLVMQHQSDASHDEVEAECARLVALLG